MQGDGKPNPEIQVRETLWNGGPTISPGNLRIENLKEATGFNGPGRYVLLLALDQGKYKVVGLPRSPGLEFVPNGDRPSVYPDVPAVRQQVDQFRAAVTANRPGT
jgi:hypothetical protein